MSIEQELCEEKKFQLQYICLMLLHVSIKGLGLRIQVYLIWSCSTWAILQWQHCTQKISSSVLDMTSHILLFLIVQYELMGQWLRWLAGSQAIYVQFKFQQGAEIFCSTSAIWRGTEPISALTRSLSYCCTLYNFFFSNFVSGDLALTGFWFLTKSHFLLYWSTWSQAESQD